MADKKISIIVPVYNAEKTLTRCVDSLLEQNYPNIEIILVDDGSKDHSLSLCRDYAEKYDRICVISKLNNGVSSARNAGLNAATGDYVMFCDSDDWVEPDWCETMVNAYKPGHLVMCGYYCHKEDCIFGGGEENTTQKEIPKEDYLLTMQIGGFAPWNKLYSREIIEAAKIRFPESITLGEDKLFVWRYLCQLTDGIIYCKKPLNHYVWPQGHSLTTNLPEDYYKQCQKIFYEIQRDIENGVACSGRAKKQFYQDSYYQYECAIRRVFQSKSMSIKKKLRLVDEIMKDNGYHICVQCVQLPANKIVRYFCKSGNSMGIYLLFLLGKY